MMQKAASRSLARRLGVLGPKESANFEQHASTACSAIREERHCCEAVCSMML